MNKKTITPKFKVGDTIRCIKYPTEIYKISNIDKSCYVFGKTDSTSILIPIIDQNKWELVEQNPADKVEPKFKVGDWVANSVETVQITGYDIDYGYQVNYKGNLQYRDIDVIEKEYHLWTIQDAKAGDIFIDIYDDCVDSTFIFSSILDDGKPCALCALSDDTFVIADSTRKWTSDKCYPATKEQCDKLLQVMKDAGYEFDFDKLELKKIDKPCLRKKKKII